MKTKAVLRASALPFLLACSPSGALGAEEWQEASFPPPSAGEARVRAPNCGTARAPDIRPNVVREGRVD